jgi:hypothetical protein
MQARSNIGIRFGPLLADNGYILIERSYGKAAIMILAAVFLMILLIMQFGKAARFEEGAEMAFLRARQLLHEADKENRSVRPLPLSLAKV